MTSTIFFGQNVSDSLSIDDVLNQVIINTDRIKTIEANYQIGNINFDNYKKSLLPQVILTAGVPYQRAIQEVVQFNGSTSLIERNFLSPTLNFTTKQIVPFTGGELTLTNSIAMNNDLQNKITNYSSNWVDLTYSQSINGFNQHRWNKQKVIYKRKLDEINYKKELAKLKTEAAQLFFQCYIFDKKIELTKSNILKTESLLSVISEKKKLSRALGIEEDQINITINQLKQKLISDQFEHSMLIKKLENLLQVDIKNPHFKSVKDFSISINKEKLISNFLKYNFENESTLQLLLADEKIDKAKKDGAINFFIQVGIGLNSSASQFEKLYNKPIQKQAFTVGAYIPILSWGILGNNSKIAKLEKENLERDLKLNKFSIVQQAENLYDYIENIDNQIRLAKEEYYLQLKTNEVLANLLTYEKKTAYDYKNQLFEYEKSHLNYIELLTNKYNLKIKLEEIFLE
ncbi:Outer membrane efflux protein [Chryseobacterium contaminans]|nr:Outer membrane efflux protein [Chryseobacterium contaminans]